MLGIIKDPTLEKLGQILDTVKDIQTQLKQMDQKLDDISKQLIDVSISIEEKDRANKATTMLSYWREFEKSYREQLDDLIKDTGDISTRVSGYGGKKANMMEYL